MSETELDTLAARVQRGDSGAFEELVFAIRRDLRIYLSAHAPSVDLVEEVLQSTLVVCYENIRKYQLRGTFLAWTKGIARNLLLKELRARSRYVQAEEDVLEHILLQSSLARVESQAAVARQEEQVARLKACMEKLPEASRALVEKRYFQRLSVKALARALNRTETWAAVTIFRIRETLRQCMMGKEVAS